MIYIIMCGGEYPDFGMPKALVEINGEKLISRTIRLLEKNHVKRNKIKISSNDSKMECFGVEVLRHYNSYKFTNGNAEGYWVDAFYPVDVPTCYLFGDVYYTEDAIRQIVGSKYTGNMLFGTIIPELKSWHEPLAYKVRKPKEFFDGVKAVKELYDQGKCKRNPIVWELYRYLNGINVNKHVMHDKTYTNIDNGGMDIDNINCIAEVEQYFGNEV